MVQKTRWAPPSLSTLRGMRCKPSARRTSIRELSVTRLATRQTGKPRCPDKLVAAAVAARGRHVSLPLHDQAAYACKIRCSQQLDVDAERRSTRTGRCCTFACNPTRIRSYDCSDGMPTPGDAEFGRYRGIADIHQTPPIKPDLCVRTQVLDGNREGDVPCWLQSLAQEGRHADTTNREGFNETKRFSQGHGYWRGGRRDACRACDRAVDARDQMANDGELAEDRSTRFRAAST